MAEFEKIDFPPSAPEIFVDGIAGAAIAPGVVKINFTSTRFDPVSEENLRRVVLTLVMPSRAASSVADALRSFGGQDADAINEER